MKHIDCRSILAALVVLLLPAPLVAQPSSSTSPAGSPESTSSGEAAEEKTSEEKTTEAKTAEAKAAEKEATGKKAAEQKTAGKKADAPTSDSSDRTNDRAGAANSSGPASTTDAPGSAAEAQTSPGSFEMPGSPSKSSSETGGQTGSDVGSEKGGGKKNREKSKSSSPISDLADDSSGKGKKFEPVEDIEENELQKLTPTRVYPYLEWEGAFRLRSEGVVNFDLNTGGTSAVLPPAENSLPEGAPANPNNGVLWSTDMNLRLDPTFHITEGLSIHTEVMLLDNLVLGSLADHRVAAPRSTAVRPDPSRTVHSSNQIPPREAEAFVNSIRVNELYGSASTFLGTFRAGRMDFDWGMGLYADGGDCRDCDYGDHVDRIMFRTKLWKFYTTAAYDFADQGETTRLQSRAEGQARDAGQIDDARQLTFMIANKPRSKKEKKVQQQRLEQQNKPAFNGGVLFSYRSQKGEFVRGPSGESLASTAERQGGSKGAGGGSGNQPELVYRGMKLYVPDVWFEFLYSPDASTKIRFELEGTGVFGSMDNTTDDPVSGGGVNCFREGQREENPEQCKTVTRDGEEISTDKKFAQLGGAFETEFYFGGPVRFGLNGGYASGGSAANWGYGASTGGELDFFRFDPNYHVDLILFRDVIGTVTNAYYGNPYIQARFLESQDRRFQAQLDFIGSGVPNAKGAPAGNSNWLGFEIDGSLQYIQHDTFRAGLQAGILFPGTALDAREGRQKLTVPYDETDERPKFNRNRDAGVAWTVQTNFAWMF